jgi:hypothetical protein
MKQTFYILKDGEYVPYSEFASDISDSFREGSYLVQCQPGTRITKKIVNPDYVAVLAAINIFREELVMEMVKQSAMQLSIKRELTAEQRAAWDTFQKSLEDDDFRLYRDSISTVTDRAAEFLLKKSNLLLGSPNVREAYEEFMTFLQLAKDEPQTT